MAVSGLFNSNQVTTQEDSQMLPRCMQDGCTLKSLSQATASAAPATVYTVTARKTLYVDQITVSITAGGGAAADFTLRDGGAGGTIKFAQYLPSAAASSFVFNLNAPISFSTDVHLVLNAGVSKTSIIGWEE